MSYWGQSFKKRAPKTVKNGIKPRKERGAIGETWWSKRWIETLESFNIGAPLIRGRSYARNGQVISIDIKPGVVKSKEQGSRATPYNIDIKLKPLSDAEWDAVVDAMAAQAIFAAKLLAGEMPQDIEQAFSAASTTLFPARQNDLETNCSCPDWSNPCKHVAAVYYILADQFDEDPFLIFTLRGHTKEQIMRELRARRSSATLEDKRPAIDESAADASLVIMENAPTLEESLSNCWRAGDGLENVRVRMETPAIENAILRRLGPAPNTLGGAALSTALARAYTAALKRATQRLK